MERMTVETFRALYPEEWKHLHIEDLPLHMQDGFANYLVSGRPMGHFGMAVLRNKLVESFMHADSTNLGSMFATVSWLYNHCPSLARGSDEKVDKWIAEGGLGNMLRRTEP